ncbi:hypothetical protein QBC35DRAFT_215132 [Podospora australis]|uniref:Uncharacterized protein n=1 Tax=Podospora australis TaxID=1536484 RepID=A0AAN6WKY9_9PEZI|nr:hypothetical protein QBC35DRAFT_215132 [Podospora australis]
MASPTFSVRIALDALQSPGFYWEPDPEIGKRASEPFEDITTEAGLSFYEETILNDNRIAEVLESSEQCNLTAYRTFAPDPTRIFQFRRGGKTAGCILVTLLWPPGSEVIYYLDSREHDFPAVASDNGLWRVPEAAVTKVGCSRVSISLDHGGLTIQDGRTMVKFVRGNPIAASFASDEFLRHWNWEKKTYLTTAQMEQKMTSSGNGKFTLYAKFVRPTVADNCE